MDQKSTINIIRSVAGSEGVDINLAQAIAEHETGLDGSKARYEDAYSYLVTPDKFSKLLGISEATETMFQKCSWGPLQVMGANCRSMGYLSQLPLLCQPQLGALYGCRFLKALQKKYPKVEDVVAAFNAGSPRLANGQYVNQSYVDDVMQRYVRIKRMNK